MNFQTRVWATRLYSALQEPVKDVCQSAPSDSELVSLDTCCEGTNAAPGTLALDCLLIIDAWWRYVRLYVIGGSWRTVANVAFRSTCCDALSSVKSAEHVGKTRWPIPDGTVRLINMWLSHKQKRLRGRMTPERSINGFYWNRECYH